MEKGQNVSVGGSGFWGKGTEKVKELVAVKAYAVQSALSALVSDSDTNNSTLNTPIYNYTYNSSFLFCFLAISLSFPLF